MRHQGSSTVASDQTLPLPPSAPLTSHSLVHPPPPPSPSLSPSPPPSHLASSPPPLSLPPAPLLSPLHFLLPPPLLLSPRPPPFPSSCSFSTTQAPLPCIPFPSSPSPSPLPSSPRPRSDTGMMIGVRMMTIYFSASNATNDSAPVGNTWPAKCSDLCSNALRRRDHPHGQEHRTLSLPAFRS